MGERRINIIVYLNKNWSREWGGAIELWSSDASGAMKERVVDVPPEFNTAVLFRTSDLSFHGMPDPVACEQGNGRRSLAIYYVSPPRATAMRRLKAKFLGRPEDPVDTGLDELRKLRAERRLTRDDVLTRVPD